jgi:hypothetical protein
MFFRIGLWYFHALRTLTSAAIFLGFGKSIKWLAKTFLCLVRVEAQKNGRSFDVSYTPETNKSAIDEVRVSVKGHGREWLAFSLCCFRIGERR